MSQENQENKNEVDYSNKDESQESYTKWIFNCIKNFFKTHKKKICYATLFMFSFYFAKQKMYNRTIPISEALAEMSKNSYEKVNYYILSHIFELGNSRKFIFSLFFKESTKRDFLSYS